MFADILAVMLSGATKPIIGYIVIASFVDIFMGLVKAAIGHRFNSTVSSSGLLKHVAMIVVPIVSSPLFTLIDGGDVYWTAFTSLILLTMIASVVENWVACGLPFPDSLTKYLDDKKTELVKLQDKEDKK